MSDKYQLLNIAYHYIDMHNFSEATKLLEQAKQAHIQEITNLYSNTMPRERKFNELQFTNAFTLTEKFLWNEMIEIY